MNPKKHLENRIRGWLPKEPNLPSYHRTLNYKTWRWRTWYVVMVLTSALVGGLLDVLATLMGLSGTGLFLWIMIGSMTIGIVGGIISAKIWQREKQQKRL